MTRPIRVLHLEDSPRDAEMIRHRLDVEDVSCDIVLANSKDSFEAALTREPFDLIISDYNLPGYDGVTALKQAQATQPDVPVILISGTVVEEQAVECLHIGATDYLLKDRLDRLVPAVRRALQEAETRRARQRVETALGESEARKAAILDSVLDCIVTMDANGTVIEFNAAAVANLRLHQGRGDRAPARRSDHPAAVPRAASRRPGALPGDGRRAADWKAHRDHGDAIGWH